MPTYSHEPRHVPAPLRERIYAVVKQIPPGKVATYGQIASIVGGCTARMVGYAMAAVDDPDVPWQRVINAQGKISPRADGGGAVEQRARLEDEGIHFDANGRIALNRLRWYGPSVEWLVANGFDPSPFWQEDTGHE